MYRKKDGKENGPGLLVLRLSEAIRPLVIMWQVILPYGIQTNMNCWSIIKSCSINTDAHGRIESQGGNLLLSYKVRHLTHAIDRHSVDKSRLACSLKFPFKLYRLRRRIFLGAPF